VAVGCAKDDLRASNVGRKGAQRLLENELHADRRGEVHDGVGASHGPLDEGLVEHGALQEREALVAFERGEVLEPARRQVVEDHGGVPTTDQRLDEVRTDEPRASRHEVGGHPATIRHGSPSPRGLGCPRRGGAACPRQDAGVDLPPITYLSVDSLSDSVGASQVLPYVEALARRGFKLRLCSLEKDRPSPSTARRLAEAGVRWEPRPFGGRGALNGLARVAKGARCLRGAELVHARSDLPAASALLARCPRWIWDMRGFWADERIEMGLLRQGSPAERAMRAVERASARRAGGIVALSAAAIEELAARHGPQVRAKATVITTCVDLERFVASPMPDASVLRLVLAGTLNRRYDVPLMLGLVSELRRRRPAELAAFVPGPSPWVEALVDFGVPPRAATREEMPSILAAAHVGLSVLRPDAGVSRKAAMPTKLGELLACGRPVVVSPGLGDMDALVSSFRAGVVLEGARADQLRAAADEIEQLVADPGTSSRCRALAEAHFDLERGVDRLVELYARAVSGP
jgi:glycosyltransferase involved in cell wall biosynthesis